MGFKNRGHLRPFLDYLARYQAVILIPTLLFIFLTFMLTIHAFEQRLIEEHESRAAQAQGSLEALLGEIRQSAAVIAQSGEAGAQRSMRSGRDMTDALKAAEALNRVRHYDLYVYGKAERMIYSPSGIMAVSEFIGSILPQSGWESNRFQDALDSLSEPALLKAQAALADAGAKKRTLPYLMPLYGGGGAPQGVAVALLDEDALADMVERVFPAGQAAFLLVDDGGEVLTDSHLPPAGIAALAPGAGNAAGTERAGREDYLVTSGALAGAKADFVTLAPRRAVLGNLIGVRNAILLAIALIAVISVLALFFIARWHYRPLNDLLIFVENELHKTFQTGNEVLFIQNGFSEILQTCEQLRQAQYNTRMAVIDHLFRNFIKGRYDRIQDFTAQASEVGIEIRNGNFFAAAASYESWGPYPIQELLEMFIARSSVELEIFGDEGVENNRLIFIFAAKGSDLNPIKIRLYNIIDEIVNQTGLVLYFGFGGIYDDATMINQSYIEAALALEFGIIKNRTVTFLTEINEISSSRIDYPSERIRQFELALFRGELKAATQELSALTGFLRNEEVPLLIVHSLECDLLRIVNRQSFNLGLEESIPLSDIRDVNEFSETVIAQIERNCEYKLSKDVSDSAKKLDVFMGYLDENYLDVNFSLQTMADEFGMSISNLSHFFRKHAPENISTYVQRMRIEKAKELLAQNSMSINDVARNSGYINRTSFMKRFKFMTGMTAGEYREMTQPGRER